MQHVAEKHVANGETQTFRLLTHNVWCHYPMSFLKQCGHAMAGYQFEQRLRLLAKHCAATPYDVIAVQELFLWQLWPLPIGRANFDLLARLLGEAGYRHHTDPWASLHAARWAGQNSGVAIFSRHPLETHESVKWARSAEWDTTKGFVCADVRLAGGRVVRIVNAHMDGQAWSAKREQICQLATYLASFPLHEFTELLVCGDMNVCPQTYADGGYDEGLQYSHLVTELSRLGLTSAWAPHESEATHERATLDHVFLRPDRWRILSKQLVRVENECGKSVSDHLGLALDLDPI